MSRIDPRQPYPGSDHPSWPAGAAGTDWPQPGTDYASWPAADRGYWGRQDPPGGSVHHDQQWLPAARGGYPDGPAGGGFGGGQADGRAPGGGQARGAHASRGAHAAYSDGGYAEGGQAVYAGGAHAASGDGGRVTYAGGGQVAYAGGTPARYTTAPRGKHQRWSAQLARTNEDTAAQTYYELDFGDGRLQVMLTEPPQGGEWSTGTLTRGTQTVQISPDQAGPVEWTSDDLGGADAVRTAERILTDADHQAAEIRREAEAQAAAIRRAAEQEASDIRQLAAAETAPVREAAEREAAEIKVQATAQAAAVREAAEREAAELRAALLEMSAELGRVAAYVTENLTSPPWTTTGPAVKPVTRPAAKPQPATEPVATTTIDEPAVQPGTRPAVRPAARPAARPDGKPRQFFAVRKVAVGASALLVLAMAAGVTEIAAHGVKFFVFRQNGAGATSSKSTVPTDQQFLNQQARGAHHKPAPAPTPTAHHTGKHHRHAKAKKPAK